MKKATKVLALIMTLVLVVGAFAACGGEKTPAVKVIKIDLTEEEYAFGVDKEQPFLLN